MSHKAIFLDRDDTIIEDPGYINSPDQVKLLAGAAGAIADFRKMGYKIIVVSNQSAVARGIITEQVLGTIHEKLKQLLQRENAYLDRIYYCPEHPDGVIKKYRKESNCRKPAPGMLLKAKKDMDIDLADSWMIGNAYRDVAAGKSAGCRTVLIKSHTNRPVKQLDDPDADFDAINLREAVNIIKRAISVKAVAKTAQTNKESDTSPKMVKSPVIDFNKNQPKAESKIDSEDSTASVDVEPKAESQSQAEVEPKQPLPPEQKSAVEKVEPTAESAKKKERKLNHIAKSTNPRTEQLLEDIKQLLKVNNRSEQFSDFSVFKLFAGILQIVVLACLFIAMRYKMLPTDDSASVFTALGFAVVFQLMTLTLFIMHNDKE